MLDACERSFAKVSQYFCGFYRPPVNLGESVCVSVCCACVPQAPQVEERGMTDRVVVVCGADIFSLQETLLPTQCCKR